MRVLVGTPVAKTVEERYAYSLFELCKYETKRGTEIDLIIKRGPYIYHNRNEIVREFLRGSWEYLLQLDMDIIFKPEMLERLLRHGKDVVFGLYTLMQAGKPISSVFNLDGKPIGKHGEGLIEVAMGGTGVCLVRRGVFEKVGEHWFDFSAEKQSEDTAFCARVREAGFKLYADLDIETAHVKDMFLSNRLL